MSKELWYHEPSGNIFNNEEDANYYVASEWLEGGTEETLMRHCENNIHSIDSFDELLSVCEYEGYTIPEVVEEFDIDLKGWMMDED